MDHIGKRCHCGQLPGRAVYFDHAAEPSLQVRELKRAPKAGALGVQTAVGPVYFANFFYQSTDNPGIKPLPAVVQKKDPNVITQWQISEAFSNENTSEKGLLVPAFYKNFSWQKLDAEASGLANISIVTNRDRIKNSVLAKVEIRAENELIKRLDFGYSDAVQVFCNGQAIYNGDNSYRSRDYRYLGTIGFFDSVYLPLKKGKNELIFIVSEGFGGWGLQAKLEDLKEVRVE